MVILTIRSIDRIPIGKWWYCQIHRQDPVGSLWYLPSDPQTGPRLADCDTYHQIHRQDPSWQMLLTIRSTDRIPVGGWWYLPSDPQTGSQLGWQIMLHSSAATAVANTVRRKSMVHYCLVTHSSAKWLLRPDVSVLFLALLAGIFSGRRKEGH